VAGILHSRTTLIKQLLWHLISHKQESFHKVDCVWCFIDGIKPAPFSLLKTAIQDVIVTWLVRTRKSQTGLYLRAQIT